MRMIEPADLYWSRPRAGRPPRLILVFMLFPLAAGIAIASMPTPAVWRLSAVAFLLVIAWLVTRLYRLGIYLRADGAVKIINPLRTRVLQRSELSVFEFCDFPLFAYPMGSEMLAAKLSNGKTIRVAVYVHPFDPVADAIFDSSRKSASLLEELNRFLAQHHDDPNPPTRS